LTPTEVGVVEALRAAGCVFAEAEAAVITASARTPDEVAAMVARRAAGAPLEQVVGWAEFGGVRIVVEPGVFVPRRRSEFLAAQAIELAHSGSVVLDLCCGSGALGATVARARASIELYACDIDPAAVRCARRNLAGLAEVSEGDLFAALPARLRGRIDVIVTNVPYVPTAEIGRLPAEARDHEPRRALDGGADGLDLQRRVGWQAAEWLASGGSVLVEVSDAQAADAAEVFTAGGLTARIARSEEFDATVVIGVK